MAAGCDTKPYTADAMHLSAVTQFRQQKLACVRRTSNSRSDYQASKPSTSVLLRRLGPKSRLYSHEKKWYTSKKCARQLFSLVHDSLLVVHDSYVQSRSFVRREIASGPSTNMYSIPNASRSSATVSPFTCLWSEKKRHAKKHCARTSYSQEHTQRLCSHEKSWHISKAM